jgi:dihydroflavonol-4-reductase
VITSEPHTDLSWHGRTVFLTGGTGFVGSHLADALVARGARVRCLVRRDPKWLEGTAVEFVEGSLLDPEALLRGVKGADIVFHMAGRTRATEREAFRRDNVEGTDNLMRAIAEAGSVARTVVASSLAAVGRGGSGVVDEDVPLDPVSDYGWSKAEMERSLAAWSSNVPLTIVRPPAVYGPRETDILTFFQSVAKGLCPIVGDGSVPSVSLVHVDDLVQGCLQVALAEAAEGRTYFLGGAEQASWFAVRDASAAALGRRVLTLPIPRAVVPAVGAVSELAGRLFGTYPPLNREKAREILEAALMCSSDRAVKDFSYTPTVSVEEGVRRTIQWYRERGWL